MQSVPSATPRLLPDDSAVSYPLARLRLGICYVGALVLGAIGLLLLDLRASEVFAEITGRLGVIPSVGLLIGIFTLMTFPLDLMGGFVLPRGAGGGAPAFNDWLRAWIRGVFHHSGFLWWAGVCLFAVAPLGAGVVVSAAAGLMILQLFFQTALARLVGNLTEDPGVVDGEERPTLCLRSGDTAFSGGISGLPGWDRIVLPAAWRDRLEPDLWGLLVERRLAVVRLGLRRRGVWTALVWNLVGVWMAAWASGLAGRSVAELVDFAAWSTLWSFVGLLVLPTWSRNAVAVTDRHLLARGRTPEDVARLAGITIGLQDGEEHRSALIERIFHPMPSLNGRLDAAESPVTGPAAWNAARLTLFLSWSSLGLLARAVHSNAGRPDLWVMGPVD